MPAAAIPLIAGGASLGSGILGFLGAKKASTPTAAEKTAQAAQLGEVGTLNTQGRTLTDFGMPKLQQAGNYFSTLAGGNRAALSQTMAPDIQNINATYGGTQRTLSRFLKGPDRDQQLGELTRERAGAISSLFTGARDRGVTGLTNLGQYGVSAGTGAFQTAGQIASGLVGQSAQNRYAGAQLQGEAGASAGNLFFNLLRAGAFNWKRSPSGLPGSTGAVPPG